jgi:hypothetical protein
MAEANTQPLLSEEEIFQAAAALPSAEGADYLRAACEGRPALRVNLEQ